jgi:Putative peptidoglycan binding domain
MSNEKIVRLLRTEGATRVFEMDDGRVVERAHGTAAWRHNNPGNLKFDYKGSADTTIHARRTKEEALAYARSHYDGVVDLDQWGNAIFETFEAGRAAQIQLLTGGKYRKETVEEMLNSYSTPDYSGATHHANQLATIYRTADQQGADLRNKAIETMTPAELAALAAGMQRAEGWQVGGIREVQAATTESLAHQKTTATSSGAVPDASASHVAPAAAHSEAVRTIQQNLNHLGYTDAQGHPLIADGHDGPRTRHAIEAFQRQLGLPVTGLANQETW